MTTLAATRAILLRRQGLLFLEAGAGAISDDDLRHLDLQLADHGFAASTRLRATIATLDATAFAALSPDLAEALFGFGASAKHEAAFRAFPEGVPVDTHALWVQRVIVHFCQAEDQPCLFCRERGTTHVLSPCLHVVCDRCFDGANYRTCPVCTRTVDPSPFFQPDPPERSRQPVERVRFRLLDLGADLDAAARAAFLGFCARAQAMSPTDRDDFVALIGDLGAAVLPWIPERVPVKENLALLLGTLFQRLEVAQVMPIARRMLATATDILRFIAAISGADVSLQPTAVMSPAGAPATWSRWSQQVAKTLPGQVAPNARSNHPAYVPIKARRFRVARLRRPLRRALLELLDALPPDTLAEDMLRHRSLWTWVGELLHPHDYARRYPTAARGFAIVRGGAPAEAPPPFTPYYARLDGAVRRADSAAMTAILRERAGELGRRFDHALRIAGDDPVAVARTTEALVAAAPALSMPVLLTLYTHLPTRVRPLPVRMYWPKGQLALGASGPDERPPLRADAVVPAVRAIEAELLRRFARKPAVADALIDAALADVIVPFNERTASRAAIALPRGSRLAIPEAKALRLFLHWCQPKGGERTDVDLSVAFYDAAWKYRGVCSYYQLTEKSSRGVVARSSGDRTDAPYPDGASEFVDIDRAIARASGYRYAAMVVNAYSGLAFRDLERATAGVMLRDDLGGMHFDPRTVELAFDLQGDHGMFLPLIVDLDDDRLHWLDVYAAGSLQFNNVATSNKDLKRLGPQLLGYFGTGERASMYDLALLHAAARAARVVIRDGDEVGVLERGTDDAAAFLRRLRDARCAPGSLPTLRGPALAVLLHGDLALPAESTAYALFREQLTQTIAASELLA